MGPGRISQGVRIQGRGFRLSSDVQGEESFVSVLLKEFVWHLVAGRSKANKQARWVERKVCFISDVGSWRWVAGGGWQTSVQTLISPHPYPQKQGMRVL